MATDNPYLTCVHRGHRTRNCEAARRALSAGHSPAAGGGPPRLRRSTDAHPARLDAHEPGRGLVGLGAGGATPVCLAPGRSWPRGPLYDRADPAAQCREDQLARRREQLALELAILGEQKSAKIIRLPEQMCRDDPSLANRIDQKAAARAGMRKAKVARARKRAVVLHRMLTDGTLFAATKAAAAA